MRRTELVIFDCDGVLVDSELIGCRVEAEELTRLGLDITAGQILERFTGATAAETFRTLEAEHHAHRRTGPSRHRTNRRARLTILA